MLLLHKSSVKNYSAVTATYENESYLVVPVIMMVEGVHAGSQGAIYHSAEALSKPTHVAGWNGRPVVINHPEVNGEYISANIPNHPAVQKVGQVFDAFAEAGKLRANAWLKLSAMQSYPDLLTKIQAGQVIEVSIGVFNDTVQEAGTWNGEDYTGIAVNHVPDHLAILPDAIGACSTEDGCGIRVNQRNNDMEAQEFISRLSINQLQVNEQSFNQIMQAIRDTLYAKETEGLYYYVCEVYPTYFIYEENIKGEPRKFFKQMYQLKADNTVTFTGEPLQVTQSTTYQPVISTNQNQSKMERQTKPCCPELVTKIIANKSNGFTEADRESLYEMGAEVVGKIMVEDPNVVSVNTSAQPSKEVVERILKAYSTKPEDLLAFMPKEIQEAVAQVNSQKAEARKQAIETIQANSTQFTEDELNEMNDVMLTKMAATFTPADRSLQGAPAPHTNKAGGQEPIYMQS